jgi:hemerythrin-like domain-containing protein
MQARGPLMIEHRLIERMLAIAEKTLENIKLTRSVDPELIDTVVDFIRTYADRTHHGKEEDIMFRELDKKPLSDDDRRIMNDLVEEHKFARSATRALVEANARYRAGDKFALSVISEKLHTLVEFYPVHIEKEDKVFFPAVRVYMTDGEDQAMLAEFWEFDRKMIHEKYTKLVEGMEG